MNAIPLTGMLDVFVGPILAQREAYVDLWCSYQINDAYIDLSIHLFDTYTRSRVNAAPPLSPNTTPLNDRTQSPPNSIIVKVTIDNNQKLRLAMIAKLRSMTNAVNFQRKLPSKRQRYLQR
jgi:hypothetical protein